MSTMSYRFNSLFLKLNYGTTGAKLSGIAESKCTNPGLPVEPWVPVVTCILVEPQGMTDVLFCTHTF